jgi:hypothetical protein
LKSEKRGDGDLPVYRGSRVEIDIDYVLHRLHIDEKRAGNNVSFLRAVKENIPVVEEKVVPAVYHRAYGLKLDAGGTVSLDGSVLEIGDVVRGKLEDAESVCIGIATIGDGVEEQARTVKTQRGLTHSFALEALGAIALDLALEEYFNTYEEKMIPDGLYTGVPLSPGETTGWRLEDQRTIYSLLEDEVEGMSITESCFLIPKNSVSFLVGIYDHQVKDENESHCNYCSMRDRCMYRRT